MGTFAGWLFFLAVLSLFSWGFWMGLMGILASHGDKNDTHTGTDFPTGADAMVYYNPKNIETEPWLAA